MDAERKLFKKAGILYGIMGVLFLGIPSYGIFLIVCGIYFYAQSNESEDTIYKNRVFHYILAVAGMTNLVGSILVFIAQDGVGRYKRGTNGINAPPKIIYKRDKESIKIDLLIKLGVAMVFVAGLLFATTSWHFINDYVKAFGLISFGVIFLVLSFFTESKLKLYRSAYMYWLLSLSLFLLTIVGVLYFGIFGEYLSFAGAGKHLAYAIVFYTAAGFILTTYFKYPKNVLLFFCCGAVLIAISYTLKYANLSQMTNVTIISIIVMVLNFINKKQGAINTFSKIISYLLFGAIITVGTDNNIEGLIACLINIINLNYLTWIDKKKDESTINVLITYALIIIAFLKFTDLGDFNYSTIAFVSTAYTLGIIGNIIPTKKSTKRISTCVYTCIMLSLFVGAVQSHELANIIASLSIPVVFLGTNWIIKRGIFNVEPWKFANCIQPFILFMLVEGIIFSVDITISKVYVYAFLSILYTIMHCLSRDSFDRGIIEVYTMFAIVAGLEFKIESTELFASIMLIVTSLYIFSRFYLEHDEKSGASYTKLIISYLLLLTSLYLPFVHYNVLNLSYWITSLSYMALIACILPFIKNEWLKKTTYIYFLVPLTYLFQQPQVDFNIQLVLQSFEKIYLVFLFIKFFIKDASLRNIILIIGIIVSCYQPFFVQSVYTGMYIGILAIILIIAGYKKDDAYPIFVTGIVMIAATIIYYLKEVWKILPFWLYLLVGGLLFIFFATYKELQKQKSK